jgi:catechol 2,3-dioxygenase-like lactoylglutathione lyase family enzyme
MPEDPCAPFKSCDDLDGELLINRTADGPAIGVELGELPFGPVRMQGASLHPYVRWTYRQTWAAKEACLGPARSVLGLAPGETVTIEVTHRESIDTTKLVREAADRSNVSSRTERGPAGSAVRTATEPAGSRSDTTDEQKKMLDNLAKAQEELGEIRQSTRLAAYRDDGQVELQPLHYAELGSPFIELIVGAIIGAVAGSAAQKQADANAALNGVAKQMAHEEVGEAGTINHDTNQRIGEIVEEVTRSERQSSVSETTTTTRESFEQRVIRTFSNPYRDRTLELRFFPVFRRFEVTTAIAKAEPGVLLRPGVIDFAVANPRATLSSFVTGRVEGRAAAAAIAADPGNEPQKAALLRTAAITDNLNANAAFYTRRLVDHTDRTGSQDALLAPFARLASAPARSTAGRGESALSLADGLAWSRAQVRNGEIHVPLAEPANWPETWREAGRKVTDGIASTIGKAAWRDRWTTTRSVQLFMGTHVEAVAGSCVLEDVPPA